jgi:hypothetical protein
VSDEAYLLADALDRRAALDMATGLAASCSSDEAWPWQGDDSRRVWLSLADQAYRWLRCRDSLKAVSVGITPGTPYPEGTTPMTTTFDLSDADSVPFTLTGLDVQNAVVPLPAGFSAAWTLADPDSTGAVLTPSADTTTAVLSAGAPDSNLLVSVAVTITNPDGSTSVLNGAEAVIVQASEAVTVGIVPGTPSPEAPATPPAS